MLFTLLYSFCITTQFKKKRDTIIPFILHICNFLVTYRT